MSLRLHFLIAIGCVFAALGQVMFKLGASGREGLVEFINPWIGVGIGAYVVGTVFWIYTLSKAPLVLVYPFTALTYVLVYLASTLLLGEHASYRAALGIGMVLAGLYVIATS